MRFRHANKSLQRMDDEPDFNGGFSAGIANAFRVRMAFIQAAENENSLRAMKS
jgi:plasmid maintenance system killer protein